jgi:hypothetical protein
MYRTTPWVILLGAVFFAPTTARAAFDIIIDDSQADFSEWHGGILQTATGDNSYGNSYHYVTGWGLYNGVDASPNNASARVFYKLPTNVDFPAGERLYNVYAWSPESNWNQGHVVDVAADGTENFAQNISWPGQFGTNKQWLALDPNKGIDPILGGRWVKLGPGPQSDASADGGTAVYLNPSSAEPYLYIGYQGYYEGTIAFDAIRIVEVVPEPSTAILAVMGMTTLGIVARRRRQRRSVA